jgi:hypothetical protein
VPGPSAYNDTGFFSGWIDLAHVKFSMLVWTVAWFVATPLWMERKGEGLNAAKEE